MRPADECFWVCAPGDDNQFWECDPNAKLTDDCLVAVTWNSELALVGRVASKRPVDHRLIPIRYVDSEGVEHVTRMWGRCYNVRIAAITGVYTRTSWETRSGIERRQAALKGERKP